MKYILLVLIFFSLFLQSQVVNKTDTNTVKNNDTIIIDTGVEDSLKIFKPTINDYKFQTQYSEKKIIDTVLSSEKTYQYSQYSNKDTFGKLQFANVGAGYNPIIYEFNPESNLALLPYNKSYLIQTIDEIKYYDVKTPTTTFIYHSGVKNGAVLQTTYTQNIGDNFNFAVEYYGLRSLGRYKNELSANNKTLFSAHYISKSKKYEAFAHFIHQNISNEENGGIANLDTFLSNETASSNRANLDVNINSADSRFAYRRYYFSHQFKPFNSEKFPFKIRHTIYNQSNKYYFGQDNIEPYLLAQSNNLAITYPLSSGKFSSNFSNTLSVLFDDPRFKLDAGLRYQIIGLDVAEPVQTATNFISGRPSENRIGAVGNLGIFLWDKIDLKSTLEFSNGNQYGAFFRTDNEVRFEPVKDYFLKAKVNFQSAAPSFNYLLNASIYNKFNYQRNNFSNENRFQAGGSLQLKWFKTELFGNYFRIDNFAFFDRDAQPQQSESSVNIAQFGGDFTFSYKKFNLNTRLLFQNTFSNKSLFPAPDLVGRLNLYYQSKAFKNAAEIQTGLKLNYYSSFKSRTYFPVLNEFILPGENPGSIGGQPIVDAYFNLKVKRMFFFVEGQHLNTLIIKNKVFTAPLYPFQDFRLNIGIVWYLIN